MQSTAQCHQVDSLAHIQVPVANYFPSVSHQDRSAFQRHETRISPHFSSGGSAAACGRTSRWVFLRLFLASQGAHLGWSRTYLRPATVARCPWPPVTGGAVRRAQIRALTCPCAHVRCTRLLVITRMRAARDRWTMTGYARPSEGRFLMNTVAKDTGTASGAMADAISAGTGSRYG